MFVNMFTSLPLWAMGSVFLAFIALFIFVFVILLKGNTSRG
jgi:hypothetical protein